jgi:hypothetical protein
MADADPDSSIVSSLPDRPLTPAEADRLRQHERVTQMASVPFDQPGGVEIPMIIIRIDSLTHILGYVHPDRPDGWRSEGKVPDLSRAAFENLVADIAAYQGVGVVERDRAGVERLYQPK